MVAVILHPIGGDWLIVITHRDLQDWVGSLVPVRPSPWLSQASVPFVKPSPPLTNLSRKVVALIIGTGGNYALDRSHESRVKTWMGKAGVPVRAVAAFSR